MVKKLRRLGTRELVILIRNSDCRAIQLLQAKMIDGTITKLKVGSEVSDHLIRIGSRIEPESLVRAGLSFTALSEKYVWVSSQSCSSCKVFSANACIPISILHDTDVGLFVKLLVPGLLAVRHIIEDLREKGLDVEIVKNKEYRGEIELTEKQYEVLKTCIDMGYFNSPRTADLKSIAATLKTSPSTVERHLRAALRKLIEQFLQQRI